MNVTWAFWQAKVAADIHGLKCWPANIEDLDHNTTRFLADVATSWTRPAARTICWTQLVFQVRKNIPSSAVQRPWRLLRRMASNMTKLKSYMAGGPVHGDASFNADIEGHPQDPDVARAMEELEHFTKSRGSKF